jgi:hypothetical protein
MSFARGLKIGSRDQRDMRAVGMSQWKTRLLDGPDHRDDVPGLILETVAFGSVAFTAAAAATAWRVNCFANIVRTKSVAVVVAEGPGTRPTADRCRIDHTRL